MPAIQQPRIRAKRPPKRPALAWLASKAAAGDWAERLPFRNLDLLRAPLGYCCDVLPQDYPQLLEHDTSPWCVWSDLSRGLANQAIPVKQPDYSTLQCARQNAIEKGWRNNYGSLEFPVQSPASGGGRFETPYIWCAPRQILKSHNYCTAWGEEVRKH